MDTTTWHDTFSILTRISHKKFLSVRKQHVPGGAGGNIGVWQWGHSMLNALSKCIRSTPHCKQTCLRLRKRRRKKEKGWTKVSNSSSMLSNLSWSTSGKHIIYFLYFSVLFLLPPSKKVQFWIGSNYFSQEIPFTFYHFFGTFVNFFDIFPKQNPKNCIFFVLFCTFLYFFHDFYF